MKIFNNSNNKILVGLPNDGHLTFNPRMERVTMTDMISERLGTAQDKYFFVFLDNKQVYITCKSNPKGIPMKEFNPRGGIKFSFSRQNMKEIGIDIVNPKKQALIYKMAVVPTTLKDGEGNDWNDCYKISPII